MKVILLQEVDNLGEEGEIVSVKNGYGRNFLIPRGKARLATTGAVKAWEEERRQSSRKLTKRKDDAQSLAKEIESLEVVVHARVGEENRIFGSITAQNVADQLASHGIEVDRRKVEINDEIRMTGVYSGSVKLHPDVTATFKIRVEPEGGVGKAEKEDAPAPQEEKEAIAAPEEEEEVEEAEEEEQE